jgi:hypothetical protein
LMPQLPPVRAPSRRMGWPAMLFSQFYPGSDRYFFNPEKYSHRQLFRHTCKGQSTSPLMNNAKSMETVSHARHVYCGSIYIE